MDNEIALIELVKKGDKKAYNTLVLKYQDRLVFSVYKFLKDFELAQDIAQEAFIKAYKNIEKFRGDSQFYTWIYRIAINTAKNVISTKARASEVYDNDATDQLLSESATTSENPENILQAEQLRSEINKALQNLPEDIRVTLSLREFDGLSYEEIAKVLNCPIGTVRSRIHKGREMLDQTFSKYNLSNFEARKYE
jgi:RNA polymerase sigma-70 factor (ECF subfamily)|tara:strand:+ start:123 stop:707 length:585 start_codon:yes stop_codon:yes gene_type:complete